jgi:hypothetical protein
VLTDGWHRIRLDVVSGSLAAGRPVLLRYALAGTLSAEAQLLPLRRLLHLYRYRRFASSLYPVDRRIDRAVTALRVHDAVAAGASHREIAQALFGAERVRKDWSIGSDCLRSRVRRLIVNARRMRNGDFKTWFADVRSTKLRDRMSSF